jgi:hypothetical protein
MAVTRERTSPSASTCGRPMARASSSMSPASRTIKLPSPLSAPPANAGPVPPSPCARARRVIEGTRIRQGSRRRALSGMPLRAALGVLQGGLNVGRAREIADQSGDPKTGVPFSLGLVVALQAGAEDSQNASRRIRPSAGPRNSYTVALTSLLPFARERRFRSAAVIARSPIHGRPPLLGFVKPSIGFVTIEDFVTGFVTSSTPKSHPPQCLSPHNRQRGASIPSPQNG